METIVGNLTKDAVVKTITTSKGERTVVNFTVAHNRRVPAGDGKYKDKTRYIECGLWARDGIAPYLLKGKVVEVLGYIEARAYIKEEGEGKRTAIPQLMMIAEEVVLHTGRSNRPGADLPVETPDETTEDDLPF